MFQATLMFAILCSSLIVAFNWNDWTFTTTEDPLDGVKIYLGHSHLKPDPECNQKINPLNEKCYQEYRKELELVLEQVRRNRQAESLKKAACCGVWKSKRCLIEALESINCDPSYVASIKNLPTDIKIQEDVWDRCSEYRENSAICQEESKSSWFSMYYLIIFLVIILAVAIAIMVAIRAYNRMRL